MAAPHTYTAEDVIEINCHCGPMPLQAILGLLLKQGARLANPGEFTLRAFLNGRIDLAQAESVLDIIRAKTSASLRIAMQGLEGNLSSSVKSIRTDLMNALAYLTARIDFPEDEIEEREIVPILKDARDKLKEIAASADQGIIYRQGIKTAIVGRRNVGKSSLLNRLLKQNRAIVSPVPGTTRDTLEEIVNILGVPTLQVCLHITDWWNLSEWSAATTPSLKPISCCWSSTPAPLFATQIEISSTCFQGNLC
jgi:tRNA modification GTPase